VGDVFFYPLLCLPAALAAVGVFAAANGWGLGTRRG
jgi:hypothetical protein